MSSSGNPAPPPSQSAPPKGPPVVLIAGITAGGVALLFVIAVIIIPLVRRRRRRKAVPRPQTDAREQFISVQRPLGSRYAHPSSSIPSSAFLSDEAPLLSQQQSSSWRKSNFSDDPYANPYVGHYRDNSSGSESSAPHPYYQKRGESQVGFTDIPLVAPEPRSHYQKRRESRVFLSDTPQRHQASEVQDGRHLPPPLNNQSLYEPPSRFTTPSIYGESDGTITPPPALLSGQLKASETLRNSLYTSPPPTGASPPYSGHRPMSSTSSTATERPVLSPLVIPPGSTPQERSAGQGTLDYVSSPEISPIHLETSTESASTYSQSSAFPDKQPLFDLSNAPPVPALPRVQSSDSKPAASTSVLPPIGTLSRPREENSPREAQYSAYPAVERDEYDNGPQTPAEFLEARRFPDYITVAEQQQPLHRGDTRAVAALLLRRRERNVLSQVQLERSDSKVSRIERSDSIKSTSVYGDEDEGTIMLGEPVKRVKKPEMERVDTRASAPVSEKASVVDSSPVPPVPMMRIERTREETLPENIKSYYFSEMRETKPLSFGRKR